ncbi:MAG: DNA ligase D [Acidobacteria bacterium]|nr:MAG: DNA ligase D [Acidobacteriota bacterium]
MGLKEYHRKRDFGITPEPRGKEKKKPGRSFVIQKHAATRLHYDFRLEMEGVLKSWAVPKGPSLDPKDKRLAMMTEDHPVEYGGFEGIIPKGQYGGGTVLLWDRGTWEPIEDPHAGLRKGNLKFRLNGEKLTGGFALVKIKGRDPRDSEKTWLLIKEKDEFVRPGYDITEARPESVTTGRTLEQIAADRDRIWDSGVGEVKVEKTSKKTAARPRPKPPAKARPAARVDPSSLAGARKAPLPASPQAQLATAVTDPPKGDEWLHEMKFDGYRILSRLEKGRVRLVSRNGKDWTDRFTLLTDAIAGLGTERAVIDGEVAVLLPGGNTSFQALQNFMSGAGAGQLVYYVFDLLYLDGYDLSGVVLEKRKGTLQQLVTGVSGGKIRYSDHVVGQGEKVFENACRMGMEGIVSKRRDMPYTPGRTRGWLKVKCHLEQEVVIGGFTDPEGTRVGLGALLVGVYDGNGRLVYAGKVGTGYTEKVLQDLRRKLEAREQKTSPFTAGTGLPRNAHWVKPELVTEVAFTEWTSEGHLRHPTFRGLREDKPAAQVVRENPEPTAQAEAEAEEEMATPRRPRRAPDKKSGAAKATVARRQAQAEPKKAKADVVVAGVPITNPDRIVYPGQGLTKRDIALYYESIAGHILPHLEGRPTTLVRCPEGMGKPCFYQKHIGYWAPDTLRRVRIQEKKKVGEYLVVDDLPGLIGLAQMGILEIHTWNSTVERLEEPDRVVFDLDPDAAVGWPAVVKTAERIRELLDGLGLAAYVKTTGGKGLHVVTPLRPDAGWDQCAEFSHVVAETIARRHPEEYLTEASKAARKGKIFIDWLRNVRGATSIAAYSTRARPGAPVSVPVTWEELARTRPDGYTVQTLSARLASLEQDPWAGYDQAGQPLSSALRQAGSLR